MSWKKIKHLFSAEGQYEWMQSHATVPTPLILNDDVVRIYFSTRDSWSRNQVGYIDVDFNHDFQILKLSSEPVIAVGPPGYFDCDGVYGTSIVRVEDEIRFYYAGWNAGLRGQFFCNIGLAISKDGGQTFEKFREVPIIGRDEIDKWSVMAPFVLQTAPAQWLMWYVSGIELDVDETGIILSRYDVKTAESVDGIDWKKSGRSAFPLNKDETNIARSCVLKTDSGMEAYYPYIKESLKQYRIGYAIADEKGQFNRMDHADRAKSILPSGKNGDWDSAAVTYPYVFNFNDKEYLLYNGNQFGKTGFGIAQWTE